MTKKPRTILILSSIIIGIWSINSCKKDKLDGGTDKELYDLAKATSGFTYFKNSTAQLNKSLGSGHSQPLLRTRYNTVAATKLDSNGKVIAGSTFPEGALIVKELYDNASTLSQYAILYKNSGSADADSKGWVWGYIKADGNVSEPASKKGSSCNSCHSQADNIDYMLMNKYFP